VIGIAILLASLIIGGMWAYNNYVKKPSPVVPAKAPTTTINPATN
jgi:hypothetical protein